MADKVRVPLDILIAITDLHKLNLSYNIVTVAKHLGYNRAADWIETHRQEYNRGVLYGFVADIPEIKNINRKE